MNSSACTAPQPRRWTGAPWHSPLPSPPWWPSPPSSGCCAISRPTASRYLPGTALRQACYCCCLPADQVGPPGGQPTAPRTVVCCTRNLRTETAMSGTTPGMTFKPPACWPARLLKAGATALAALLVACGGGSGDLGGSNTGGGVSALSRSCGPAVITMQDTAGDFLSYTVDVVSPKLRKARRAKV